MRPSIDANVVWIGLGLWVLFMVGIFARYLYQQYQQKRAMQRLDRVVDSRKKKKPFMPPLELEIADTWIKCEYEVDRNSGTSIQALRFSFYDANGVKTYSDNYGSKEAKSYSDQLYKLLTTTGFENVERSSYGATYKSVFERKA